MSPRITILGCGLSSMLAALGFAAHNIPTTIIEGRSVKGEGFFNDIRTTALTAASKKTFEKFGIWNDILKISGMFNDIYVADNKAESMIHFTSAELKDGQKLGYLVQNTNFKKALFNLVTSNQLINVLDDTSYIITENSPQGCKLLLNNQTEHECDLLIISEGRNSPARKKYFSSEVEKSYGQHAITFIVQHEKPHEGTAVEHFLPQGPFAILPLQDQNLSSVVWTIKSEMRDLLMNLPIDEFAYTIGQNFGNFLGKIEIQGERAAFPLGAYATNKYYNKSIALIADSAHIIHPLAGQGLNQGIKDIESLIFVILQYGVTGHALDQYQKARKADNNNMLEITDMLNTLFSNHSRIFHGMRQVGFKAIEKIPILKKLLVEYAMGKRSNDFR